MDFAFYRTQHDRAAHLRADGAWRTPDLKVMVVGGEHVASVQGHLESVLSSDGLRTLERLVRTATAQPARA